MASNTVSSLFPILQFPALGPKIPHSYKWRLRQFITTRLAETYHSKSLPVILSTPDHQYALGGYAPSGQNTDREEVYNQHFFNIGSFADSTAKFNVIFYKRPHGTEVRHYTYRTYLCIGTLNAVTDCLHKIMTAVPH